MKFIIIYNDTIRSKIIYTKFIHERNSDIICAIKIPVLTKSKSGKTSTFLIKKLLNSNIRLQFFHFFQIFIYQLFGFFNNSTLTKLLKKNNIKVYKLKNFPDYIFLKNLQKKEIAPIIIFASTTTILKEENLKNNVILNFHEGPENYKGSAIFYYLALKDEKNYYTMITQPDLGIDTGEIIKKSNLISIMGKSIFQIFLSGVYEQSKLIFEIKNLKLTSNKFQKNIKKTFSYSYPTKETDHILKKKGIKNIEFFDLLKILKISLIEDSDKLYDYIKKLINNEKN